MVPAYAREQDGFDVQRVVNHDRVEKDRTPQTVVVRFECDSPIRGAITWTRVPRLKTDARCQYALAGRLVGVCLDISFHRRRTNGAPSLARIRCSYRNIPACDFRPCVEARADLTHAAAMPLSMNGEELRSPDSSS